VCCITWEDAEKASNKIGFPVELSIRNCIASQACSHPQALHKIVHTLPVSHLMQYEGPLHYDVLRSCINRGWRQLERQQYPYVEPHTTATKYKVAPTHTHTHIDIRTQAHTHSQQHTRSIYPTAFLNHGIHPCVWCVCVCVRACVCVCVCVCLCVLCVCHTHTLTLPTVSLRYKKWSM